MTSHKEQPAVDTSAEKLREQAKRGSELAVGLETTERERFHWLNADMAAWMGTSQHVHMDNMRALINDINTLLRSLAAHPAEPAGMELETTAEEQAEWRKWHNPPYADRNETRLVRDLDRMRARAEKAEAALKQPVSDEEVEGFAASLEQLAQWVEDAAASDMEIDIADVDADELRKVAGVLRRAGRECDALSTQLRDAQARGKGMEEAPTVAVTRMLNALDYVDPTQIPALSADDAAEFYAAKDALRQLLIDSADAALSRPEGSAST